MTKGYYDDLGHGLGLDLWLELEIGIWRLKFVIRDSDGWEIGISNLGQGLRWGMGFKLG